MRSEHLKSIHSNSKTLKKSIGKDAFSIHRSELKHADKLSIKGKHHTGVRRGSPARTRALRDKIK